MAKAGRHGGLLERFPVLGFLMPLTAGIACAGMFESQLAPLAAYLWAGAVAAAVATAAIAMTAARAKRQTAGNIAFPLSAVLFFTFLGAATMTSTLRRTQYPWPQERCVYEAVVMESPKTGTKTARMRVKVVRLWTTTAKPPKSVGKTVALTAMRSAAVDTLKPGDGIVFAATVSPPENPGNPYEPDYAAYQRLHGVGGTAFVFRGSLRRLSPASAATLRRQGLSPYERLTVWGGTTRKRLAAVYSRAGLGGDRLAILSAMTLGDRQSLSRDTRSVFSDTGVSHLLALSGLHLGIVYSLLQLLLTFGGRLRAARVPAQAAIVAFVWAFALVAGMPLSLIRAAIMYSIVSLCMVLGRDFATLGNLCLAAFLILLFSPASLFDVGFQLSFVSVFFILRFLGIVAPPRVVAASAAGKIWGMIAVSLCAQAGVAPLIAYYFHSFPAYFVISNLVAVPLTTAIVWCGLLLLAASPLPLLPGAIACALNTLLAAQTSFLGFLAAMPHASVAVYPSLTTVVMIYAAMAFAALWLSRRGTAYACAAVCAMAAAVAAEACDNRQESDVAGIYFYKGLSASVVHFIVSPADSYLYSPAENSDSAVARATAGVARQFWKRCGIAAPKRMGGSLEARGIVRRGEIVQCGRRRVCVLDSVSRRRIPAGHITTDALYVSKSYKRDISGWVEKTRPRVVVLDYRMTPWWRSKYAAECRAARVRLYDLAANPCLKIADSRGGRKEMRNFAP